MNENKSKVLFYRRPCVGITTAHPKSMFGDDKTIEIPESDYVLLRL